MNVCKKSLIGSQDRDFLNFHPVIENEPLNSSFDKTKKAIKLKFRKEVKSEDTTPTLV